MDRIERKHQLRAMLDALRLPETGNAVRYDALLGQLDVHTNPERDILRAALTDAIYDARRHSADETKYQRFLDWLGGFNP